eukprot:10777732-Ditylum_brightwellii.AAC.1
MTAMSLASSPISKEEKLDHLIGNGIVIENEEGGIIPHAMDAATTENKQEIEGGKQNNDDGEEQQQSALHESFCEIDKKMDQ